MNKQMVQYQSDCVRNPTSPRKTAPIASLSRTLHLRSRSVAAIICAIAVTPLFVSGGSWAASAARSGTDVSIATQLKQIQRGNINGREYLTLHIGGHDIGPSSCRSNILRMDTRGDAGAERQKEIEAIAISAMLTATSVMIVVPLDTDQCVDGKPTFTNLYPLDASPVID